MGGALRQGQESRDGDQKDIGADHAPLHTTDGDLVIAQPEAGLFQQDVDLFRATASGGRGQRVVGLGRNNSHAIAPQ